MNEQWYSLKCFKIHKRNLSEIKHKGKERLDNSPPQSIQFAKLRYKGLENHRKQLSVDIYAENQQILQRIEEISNRPNQLLKIFSTSSSPKKLIQFKNKLFASQKKSLINTISAAKSVISHKKLEQAYEETKKLRKNLKKRNFMGFISHKKLTPIERLNEQNSIMPKAHPL